VEQAVEYCATGRRKTSVARVRLSPGTGEMSVNGSSVEEYFPRETLVMLIKQPLECVDALGKYNLRARVSGGGMSGQAGAIRLGIARALVKVDEEMRSVLRRAGYLTRDPRMKERKKYGQKGARARFQYSKR
jgi:small subunit ribosomal protein S9